MVAIKLKLTSSGASLTSGSSGNVGQEASSQAGPSGSQTHGNGGSGDSSTATAEGSSNGHSATSAPLGALGNGQGTDTPTAGKRKKGSTSSKSTSRKSVGTPSQPSNPNKRQKRDAPPTPTSARPTAIPAHVYTPSVSASPSPSSMAPPPLPSPSYGSSPLPGTGYDGSAPETPGSDVHIKDEPFDSEDVDTVPASPDPLSMPYTPTPMDDGEPMRGRTGGKVTRIKRPFKVLAEKVLAEMRKKDDYGIFGEPVDTDEYPDYLGIIGGKEKAMDIGTMAEKLDNGEYRSMDDIERDLRTLVTAAQTYNPPGSKPYSSAGRLLTHGLKHIEKNRPIVITPSPSPERAWRGQSTVSGRETTHPPNTAAEDVTLPPQQYIPIEMLAYPPNSLQGRAVAWHLTGGKKVYAKREIRAREKFAGKWRRWGVDGSREVDDMDDIDDIFYASRLDAPRGSNPYTTSSRKVADYTHTPETYWEWPGFGGVLGQPPVPFTQFPLRPHLATKVLGHSDFGVQPEVEDDIEAKRSVPFLIDSEGTAETRESTWGAETTETDMIDTLFDHALLAKRQQYPSSEWHMHYEEQMSGVYASSGDWIKQVSGGTLQRAYAKSVQAFIDGARKSAGARPGQEDKEVAELERYEVQDHRPEVYTNVTEHLVMRTFEALGRLSPAQAESESKKDVKADSDPLSTSSLLARVQTAHYRAALRYILDPSDLLDFVPLFRRPEEFTRGGMQGQTAGVPTMDWIGKGIVALDAAQRKAVAERLAKVKGEASFAGGDVKMTDTNGHSRKEDGGTGTGNSSPLSDAPDLPNDRPDPYARTLQIVSHIKPDNTADMELIQKVADTYVVLHERAGVVCGRFPTVGSSAQLRPATNAKGKKTGQEVEQEQEKQLFPADLALLRLEIMSMAKHYALPGVRKMTKGEAERLLPSHVHKFLADGET